MTSSRAALALLAALFLVPLHSAVAEPTATDPWAGWRFLAGDWVGEGAKDQGTGAFSFRFELDDRVLVRRNHADLPAANGRPAAKHDDLMVVHPADAAGKKEAVYFDNEGHVLHYAAELSGDGKVLTFVTAPAAAAPRFRLTYTRVADDALDIRFEIAPPGSPEKFAPYLSGHARRASAAR